jgi:tuftelin-interacting protein 11
VYGFGSVSVILDNMGGVIRAQLGPRWAPVSLDQLLSLVLSRPAR